MPTVSEGNDGNTGVWKPLALSLMSALLTLCIAVASLWPRNMATRDDQNEIRAYVEMMRQDVSALTAEVAALRVRVELRNYDESHAK